MKYYVEFLTDEFSYSHENGLRKTGNLCPAMGSEAIYILDGRNTKERMIEDAKERYRKMLNVHPNYKGFILYKGNLKNSTPITRVVF